MSTRDAHGQGQGRGHVSPRSPTPHRAALVFAGINALFSDAPIRVRRLTTIDIEVGKVTATEMTPYAIDFARTVLWRPWHKWVILAGVVLQLIKVVARDRRPALLAPLKFAQVALLLLLAASMLGLF